MIDPRATNRVYCTGPSPDEPGCGWDRILDPTRAYRGGHTHPETGEECYGQLAYEEIEPAPPIEEENNG